MSAETKQVLGAVFLIMVAIATGFVSGYNAGVSDVITSCVRDAEFQRGDDYILCEIED